MGAGISRVDVGESIIKPVRFFRTVTPEKLERLAVSWSSHSVSAQSELDLDAFVSNVLGQCSLG